VGTCSMQKRVSVPGVGRTAVTLCGITAACLLGMTACGGAGELRWDNSDAPADVMEQAREAGNLAACENGTFDSKRDLSENCDGRDGVVGWLYKYGVCFDGKYIAMAGADDPSCDEHDGFQKGTDTSPQPADADIALCANGLYDDDTYLEHTCDEAGGVAEWRSTYAACADGHIYELNEQASCADHDGWGKLLPGYDPPDPAEGDVALCANGLYDDDTYLQHTCDEAGGVAEWLSTYAECADGHAFVLTEQASCSDHGGWGGLLPVDFAPVQSEGDLARCTDGTYDNLAVFDRNCLTAGGVAEWLAGYAQCGDGTFAALGPDDGCDDRGGVTELMPEDFSPPTTTTTTTITPARPAPPPRRGLGSATARAACKWYGEEMFPYGFDAHTVMGMIAEEERAGGWFFKFEADITNAFGAERAAVVECEVSGTDDAPVVVSFLAY